MDGIWALMSPFSNILPLKTNQIDCTAVDLAFLRRPSIESEGVCGELREIIRAVAGLNGVEEREGAGAAAGAVDGEAINGTDAGAIAAAQKRSAKAGLA